MDTNDKEIIEWVKRGQILRSRLSQDEIDALWKYTSEGYYAEINRLLNTREVKDFDTKQKLIHDNIESAIDKGVSCKYVLYRGGSIPKRLQINDIFFTKSFWSTSLNILEAAGYAAKKQEVLIKILPSPKLSVAFLGGVPEFALKDDFIYFDFLMGQPFSIHWSEYEVLLPKNVAFKVIAKEKVQLKHFGYIDQITLSSEL